MAHYVENTNLILVITEAEKDGCDKCKLSVDPKDLIQEPVEPSAAEGKSERGPVFIFYT